MQVITANRLSDGRVVYLDGGGCWTPALAAAAVFATEALAAGLAAATAATAAAARQEVVDPYAVEIRDDAGGRAPRSLRERIRAFGPTTAAGA